MASLFDKLPDEIVSLILSSVYGTIFFPHRRPTLLVNKRFSRLTDTVTDDWYLDSGTLPCLFRQPHLHRVLRRANCQLHEDDGPLAFKYMSLLLPSFSALTSITVTGSVEYDEDGELVQLPAVFTEALTRLEAVSTLSIALEHDWALEDEDFTLSKLRQLKSLKLANCACIAQLLGSTPPSLRHLSLAPLGVDEEEFAVLPWHQLTSLQVSLADMRRQPPPVELFIASIRAATMSGDVRFSFLPSIRAGQTK